MGVGVASQQPLVLAGERTLAVAEPFGPLLPGGTLKRGTTVQISGAMGVTSLGLALAATPAQAGSWLAVVGHRSLGLAAAAELGVPLSRLVLVGAPRPKLWAATVAALVDAFDLVLVAGEHRVNARDGRRLAARARERSNVIVRLGNGSWPEAADVRLHIDDCQWQGLGAGHGVLSSRLLTVSATGRGAASRPQRVRIWLPDAAGKVRLEDDSAVVRPFKRIG